MRSAISASVVTLTFAVVSSAALARDLPLMGGPGGAPRPLRCSSGEYVVGFSVKAGLWVDQVSIKCAGLKREGSNISHVSIESRGPLGGAGGGLQEKTCVNGRAVGSIGVSTFSNKTKMVREIVFGCVTDTTSGGGTITVGNSSGRFPATQSCGRGEAAVGVNARVGGYVDAIGLICERIKIAGASTSPSAGTSSTPPPPGTSKIVAFAQANVGKCVDRSLRVRNEHCPSLPFGQIGDGECTDLVNGAVVSAGFPKVAGYVWGAKVGDNTTADKSVFRPGDIIQLFGVKLVGSNGFWETSSQHTAIIEANNNGVLSVIEQNTNSGSENRRYVTRGTLNLTWNLSKGTYIVYRK